MAMNKWRNWAQRSLVLSILQNMVGMNEEGSQHAETDVVCSCNVRPRSLDRATEGFDGEAFCLSEAAQGYLARKKTPPPPRTSQGP